MLRWLLKYSKIRILWGYIVYTYWQNTFLTTTLYKNRSLFFIIFLEGAPPEPPPPPPPVRHCKGLRKIVSQDAHETACGDEEHQLLVGAPEYALQI